MHVAIVEVSHSSFSEKFSTRVHAVPKKHHVVAQLLHLPLSVEAGEAGLAGQELLHGGLLEVALLGDEPVQPAQQLINIAQRGRDGALFREGRARNRHPYELVTRKMSDARLCDVVREYAPLRPLPKDGGQKTNVETLQRSQPMKRLLVVALFNRRVPNSCAAYLAAFADQ